MLVISLLPVLGNGLVCSISNLLYSLLMVFTLPQQYIPSVGGASSNQPWNLARAPNAQVQPSNPATQAPQDVSIFNHNVSTIASQPSARDVKSIGRSELPADFFAMNYSSFRTPVPGWQTGPPHGMAFAMQYNTAVPMPTFLQLLKSATRLMSTVNLLQASTEYDFPPMASSRGALPNVRPPSGLMPTSSLGDALISLDATPVILIFIWIASPSTTICINITNASKCLHGATNSE